MSDIGVVAAFLGGSLALLSPCSALLLPAFFAYSFSTRVRLLGRTLVFYAGLCLTLVPLGVAGSFASRLFYGHRDLLITAGGWLLIVLGIAQVIGFGFGSRRMAQAAGRRRTGSALSVFALGAVYGLAGFCAGPILGGILTIAAVDGSPMRGGLLLAVYALGMAVPIFVLALLWDRYDLGRRRWLRGRTFNWGPFRLHSTSVIGGALFVVIGVLFLAFDGTSALPALISTDSEFGLEEKLTAIGDAVPDRLLLVGAAAFVGVAAAVVLLRSARRLRAGSRENPGESSEKKALPHDA